MEGASSTVFIVDNDKAVSDSLTHALQLAEIPVRVSASATAFLAGYARRALRHRLKIEVRTGRE